jgi:hypothetical protein
VHGRVGGRPYPRISKYVASVCDCVCGFAGVHVRGCAWVGASVCGCVSFPLCLSLSLLISVCRYVCLAPLSLTLCVSACAAGWAWDPQTQQQYRIMAVDHDLVSFRDATLSTWPQIVVTNPKDARFHSAREPLSLMATYAQTLTHSQTNTYLNMHTYTHIHTRKHTYIHTYTQAYILFICIGLC